MIELESPEAQTAVKLEVLPPQIRSFGWVENLSDGRHQPGRKPCIAPAQADPFDPVDDPAEPRSGYVGRERRPFVMVHMIKKFSLKGGK